MKTKKKTKRRKCSVCKKLGHNRRSHLKGCKGERA